MPAPRLRRFQCVAMIALVSVAALVCNRSDQNGLPTLKSVTSNQAPDVTLFSDITKATGVDFTYRNGTEAGHCSILESLGGGIGSIDFDRDGQVDLCVSGGGLLTEDEQIQGLPAELFRNLGENRFEKVGEVSGIASTGNYTHGVAIADYDNDGFHDIVISGFRGSQLWLNRGDGTFQEAGETIGLASTRWTSCAAWGDFNQDGNLDLYVTNYVNWSFDNHLMCTVNENTREICPPKSFQPLPDQLFFSNGDGSLREVTGEVGLREDGKGLGVLLADVDNDLDLDIYIANDTTPNFLYLNDGNGKFNEDGFLRGVALDEQGFSNGSMGVDLCDFNRDGLCDIFVANYENESFALYRNEGNAFFVHVSQPTGITSLGELFVGFGSVCADFDRDGDEDVVVTNGHVVKYPRAATRRQVPLYLENNALRFRRATFSPESYFGRDHEGRGLAAADLDNDGDLDLVFSHLNDPIAILRNDVTEGDWLAVELTGVASNRDAIGTRLVLHTQLGQLVRQIKGGASYLSTGDRRVYWGFPQNTAIEKLTIHWPSGIVQEIVSPETGHILPVIELPHQEAG